MSSSKKLTIWDNLQKLWITAFKGDQKKTVQDCQKEAGDYYRENKSEPEAIAAKIKELELQIKCNQRLNSGPLFKAFSKIPKNNQKLKRKRDNNVVEDDEESNIIEDNINHVQFPSDEPHSSTSTHTPQVVQPTSSQNADDIRGNTKKEANNLENSHGSRKKSQATPKQEKIRENIIKIITDIAELSQENGLINETNQYLVKALQKEKVQEEKKLKRLQCCQRANAKARKNKQKLMKEIVDDPILSTLIKKKVKCRSKAGRPRIEEEQPALLKTITEIAMSNSSADDRRRTETIKMCRTLDDLHTELLERGFILKRTTLYYRLIPRNSNSIDGKKHVSTVPVKLARAQNNLRKHHPDAHFASASIKHIKDLAQALGPNCVSVISQDDKAKVPIGIAAANLQAPLLMHLQYKVMLPDHDWVVASRHKLTPSVYAGLTFNSLGEITYSGPTYIAIRSGKHDTSTAESHSTDLDRLFQLENFQNLVKTVDGKIKPILILLVDGGPDESPRSKKVLEYACSNFAEFDLDALIIATHAPHHSAYNPVERRMAPLSRELAGVVLDHDACGTHLDKNGKTIDTGLEIQNFKHAGEALANIWSGMIIDEFPVYAEYIDPPPPSTNGVAPDSVSETISSVVSGSVMYTQKETTVMKLTYYQRHVRQSRYLLQIIKCLDESCCSKPRTNIHKILPDTFLPPPVLFEKTPTGIQPSTVSEEKSSGKFFGTLFQRLSYNYLVPKTVFEIFPYDYYCPSKHSTLMQRYCKDCKLVYPSIKNMMEHRPIHSREGKAIITVVLGSMVDEEEEENILVENEDAHVIQDIENWNAPVFITAQQEEVNDE